MSNQDKKENIFVRKSRPQTLAASFGSLMDRFGIRSSDAILLEKWRDVVGNEIANISNVVAIKTTKDNKFNIVLRPINSAFALELSYKVEECINKINKYYGRKAVSKITIRK
ncbi:MAG: DUF721 domain-containing protein [Alphaproteobacteria bacterium]|nr:DUF721 domain-containing protein [Alphaproteobacteria bacterium]